MALNEYAFRLKVVWIAESLTNEKKNASKRWKGKTAHAIFLQSRPKPKRAKGNAALLCTLCAEPRAGEKNESENITSRTRRTDAKHNAEVNRSRRNQLRAGDGRRGRRPRQPERCNSNGKPSRCASRSRFFLVRAKREAHENEAVERRD